MRKVTLLAAALLLLLSTPSEGKPKRRGKGYSFPLATFAEGGTADRFQRFMRKGGIKAFQEEMDFGFIVHAGPFPGEADARYLEPFFCLRSKEYEDRAEAERRASFVRDRNFPAMVDSRYDIARRSRVFWVYIGYARTRAEAQEVMRGFAYYPDVSDYLTSTDAEDEEVVAYIGGYLSRPGQLYRSADVLGDRKPEILLLEDRTNEPEVFSEVAPPSNKPVESKHQGYAAGPLLSDLALYYYDDLAGGWKKAGTVNSGADPMTFMINSDVRLLYRDLDGDAEKEIVMRAVRQEMEGAKVCSKQDMIWIYDLVQDSSLRYWKLEQRHELLDAPGSQAFSALDKNRKWRGEKAMNEMLAWAEKRGHHALALSIYAGLLDENPAIKVEKAKSVFRLLSRTAKAGRCQQPQRCGRTRNTYSWQQLGPVVQRLARHYTGDKGFWDVLTRMAAACKKCQEREWVEETPYCAGYYRALGLAQPEKGEELSREYYREGMRKYVGIDEDRNKGPKALLDFLLAAELDPENGEAIYKAACVAAKRNALALAADLLRRSFDKSLTFKARAKDDDNFADLVHSPQFSDLFGD